MVFFLVNNVGVGVDMYGVIGEDGGVDVVIEV